MKKKSFIASLMVMISFIFISISSSLVAQDTADSKYGSDPAECKKNISIYSEFYKQWKKAGYKGEIINDVIGPWSSAYKNCPKSTKNIYLHGEKIYKEYYIKNEKDKATRDKYVDSLMSLYDKRIEFFGKKGYVLDKKGRDLYRYRPSAYEEVYHILKEAVSLNNDKSTSNAIVYYFRTAEKLAANSKIEISELVSIFDQVIKICDANIEKYADKAKKKAKWESTKGNVELTFQPWATCDVLVPMFEKKLAASPDDIELLKKITQTLDSKDCTDSPLFFSATEKLNELEPSAKASYLMGKMMMRKKKDYNSAIKYFKAAISLYEEEAPKEAAYLMTAVAYSQLKQYANARTYARKALSINPNNGKAYIIIGDAYASSRAACVDKELPEGAIYWLAVDYYQKARSVDKSVASMASTKISGLKPHFPNTERAFFFGLTKGAKVTIKCWINETTTVRTSD